MREEGEPASLHGVASLPQAGRVVGAGRGVHAAGVQEHVAGLAELPANTVFNYVVVFIHGGRNRERSRHIQFHTLGTIEVTAMWIGKPSTSVRCIALTGKIGIITHC